MHAASAEPVSVLPYNLVEVVARVPVVQVHGQLVLLSQIEVIREHFQLLLLGRPLQPIVIQPALPNGDKFRLNPNQLLLKLHKILINTLRPVLIERFLGPARMHANGGKAIIVLLAHLVGDDGVLDTPGGDE